MIMARFNKIYHKGPFRSGEYAKHLRPYLKRKGNKRFRKFVIDEERAPFPERRARLLRKRKGR